MSVNDPHDAEVVALQYDETAVADDLANWCGGVLVTLDGQRCIRLLEAPAEHDLARPGDWIVRIAEGQFTAMDPDEFAARLEPRPADDPLS